MGMQKGDRIVAVQGRDVAQLLDLVRGLRRRSGDEQGPRTLSVQRGDQRVELSWDEGD
jgi:S1-C subfamily serine protease